MRLIFCHIPKVAGKSILGNIQKYIPREKTIKVYNIGGDILPRHFHDFELPEDWQFLVGHIHIGTLLTNPGLRDSAEPTIMLSSVRDPIDRMVSLYNFIANRPRHPEHDLVQTMEIQDFIAECPANAQLRYLRPPDGAYPSTWQIHIVPIDRVDEAAAEITGEVTGKMVSREAFSERHNVTAKLAGDKAATLKTRQDLPETFIAQMYDRHDRDRALYQEARQTERIAQLPSA